MKSNQLLQNILKEVNRKNCDQIVAKYLNGADADLIVDTHDLLVQLQKSVESYLFSTILAKSADIDPSSD